MRALAGVPTAWEPAGLILCTAISFGVAYVVVKFVLVCMACHPVPTRCLARAAASHSHRIARQSGDRDRPELRKPHDGCDP